MAKRIILLLDGTWNDSDFGGKDTNIVRIRDIIARSLWAENDTVDVVSSDGVGVDRIDQGTQVSPTTSAPVTPKAFANMNNIVFYERGVGTGAFLDRFTGGALGEGLSQNIRRAYKFLSFHYVPCHRDFVFGFYPGAL